MARKKRSTADALTIIERTIVGRDEDFRRRIAEESLNAEVAALVFQARTEAGLTQEQLARLVGTSRSVISRLEDADYRGHSLTMLQRIAKALGRKVRIELIRAP